jgi:[ribosomal protein S18]-alanine N-acetyltransferase
LRQTLYNPEGMSPSKGSSGVAIRNCRLSDLEAVLEIEAASFDDPYPMELFEAFLQKYPQGFRIAMKENKIVGYCIIALSSMKKGAAVLTSLAVRPEFKRLGIASELLADGILIAREMISQEKSGKMKLKKEDDGKLLLQVAVENIAAQALYAKFGFASRSTLKDYYGKNKDAIQMELAL